MEKNQWIGAWYAYRYDVTSNISEGETQLRINHDRLIKTPITFTEEKEDSQEDFRKFSACAFWGDHHFSGPTREFGGFLHILLHDLEIAPNDRIKTKGKLRITITLEANLVSDKKQNTLFAKGVTNTFTYDSNRTSQSIGLPIFFEKNILAKTEKKSNVINFEEAPEIVKEHLKKHKTFISTKNQENKNSSFLHVISALIMLILFGIFLSSLMVNKSKLKILENLGFGHTKISSSLDSLEGVWVSLIDSPQSWGKPTRKEKTGDSEKGTAVILWGFTKNENANIMDIKRYGGGRNFYGYATINAESVVFYLWEKETLKERTRPRYSILRDPFNPEDAEKGKIYLLSNSSWSYESNVDIPMLNKEIMVKLEGINKIYSDSTSVDKKTNSRTVKLKSKAGNTSSIIFPLYVSKKKLDLDTIPKLPIPILKESTFFNDFLNDTLTYLKID